MKTWDYQKVGSLKDKIIVVTGGNSGLGLESVRFFSSKGASVIMASRSITKSEEAKRVIIDQCGDCLIDTMYLDLASLSSVNQFVHDFKKKYDHIDILLNNAGIMIVPYGLTEDGFEKQFGINHLGHFALTAQLFDLIKKGTNPRIVNISSQAHRIGTMDFHNLMYEQGVYSEARAYGRSKLANLLFTFELNKRVKEKGLDIKVLAAHPGSSRTNLTRYVKEKKRFKLFSWLFNLTSQSAFRGSLPGIRACLDPSAESGEYYGPSGVMQLKGHPVVVKSSSRAQNSQDALELWNKSEELVKLKFTL